jgi:hypothetical protein
VKNHLPKEVTLIQLLSSRKVRVSSPLSVEKKTHGAERKCQKAQGVRWKAKEPEFRSQEIGDRGRKSEVRGQTAEDRRQQFQLGTKQ